MAKPKLKTKAATWTAQSKEDVQSAIRQIGDLQREQTRRRTRLDDAKAALDEAAAGQFSNWQERIAVLQQGVQAWCEANREQLCGKGKTANLITGEVSWRVRPPSVRLTKADAVIDALKRLGLGRFVRTKEEVNKDAVLNDPDAVRGVAGLAVSSGVEDFVITPFETEVPS